MNAVTPTRPALRYMGGKWRIAPWIVEKMPPHRSYVEPFGGAASVLLRKPRAFQEIYNDLDDEVVNLFRVLRDPKTAAALVRMVDLTPWARTEFETSYLSDGDPVTQAHRTIVRSFMGFGSTAVALRRRTGFRAGSDRNGKHPARDWLGMPDALELICTRLRGVVIERRPALQVLAATDDAETLVYADPPYVHEARSQKRIHGGLEHAYAHELDADQHLELLGWLNDCKSMVLLSGYRSDLYDQQLGRWHRYEISAFADGGRRRQECLWANPAAQEAKGLFGAIA